MKYLMMLIACVMMTACYSDVAYDPDPYYPVAYGVGGYWYVYGGVRMWHTGAYVHPGYGYRGGYHGGYRGGYHGGYHGGHGGHGGHR